MIVGVGVDICAVQRMREVTERHGPRFLDRVFVPEEQELFAPLQASAHRVAARFAAKEAAMKALGTGRTQGVRFLDIHVLSLPTGQPTIRLHGRAAEVAGALGATRVHVSLSHEREHAIAFVVLESDGAVDRP